MLVPVKWRNHSTRQIPCRSLLRLDTCFLGSGTTHHHLRKTNNEIGNPTIGGYSGSGYQSVSVPPVAAIDYRPDADFILTAGGQVTNQAGAVLCDQAGGENCQAVYGWDWGGASWTAGRTILAGTYYVEGSARIDGAPGSPAAPVSLSVIAEGDIRAGRGGVSRRP